VNDRGNSCHKSVSPCPFCPVFRCLRPANGRCISVDNSTCPNYHAALVCFARHKPLLIVNDLVGERTEKCGEGTIASVLASKRVIITRGNTDERLHVTAKWCEEGRTHTLTVHSDYVIAGKKVNRHAYRELVFCPKPSCKANQCAPNDGVAPTAAYLEAFSGVLDRNRGSASHQASFNPASAEYWRPKFGIRPIRLTL
jgi:hypothetical protein